MTVHELRIEGMSCEHCVRAVERALSAISGVKKVEVGVGNARVETEDSVPRAELVRAVESEDYTVV